MRNPRINVVVTPESFDILKRCSKATGDSVSTTVGELVEAVAPVLERVAMLSEMAVKAKEDVREGLRIKLGKSQKELEPVLEKAMEALGFVVKGGGRL
jgi:hypothetical protein